MTEEQQPILTKQSTPHEVARWIEQNWNASDGHKNALIRQIEPEDVTGEDILAYSKQDLIDIFHVSVAKAPALHNLIQSQNARAGGEDHIPNNLIAEFRMFSSDDVAVARRGGGFRFLEAAPGAADVTEEKEPAPAILVDIAQLKKAQEELKLQRRQYEDKLKLEREKMEVTREKMTVEMEKARFELQCEHYEERKKWVVRRSESMSSARKPSIAQRTLTHASNFSLAVSREDQTPLKSPPSPKPRKWGIMAWAFLLCLLCFSPAIVAAVMKWDRLVINWLAVGGLGLFSLIMTFCKCMICTDTYLEEATWDCFVCCSCCHAQRQRWWHGCILCSCT